jgi:hypothetical protein
MMTGSTDPLDYRAEQQQLLARVGRKKWQLGEIGRGAEAPCQRVTELESKPFFRQGS